MDPSLEEAAQTAGASVWTTMRTVTLPVLLPAVLATLLISFIRALESFEAPAIMGIPAGISVFATEVWLAVSRTRPADFNLSATFAMGYLLVTVVGVYLYHRATKMSERYVTVTGKGYRPTRFKLGYWRWPVALFSLLLLGVAILLPLFILIWTSLLPFYMIPSWQALSLVSLQNYRAVLALDSAYEAFVNTLIVGCSAAAIGSLLSAVIGWVVIRTRLPGRRLLDVLAFAPIAIPGTVMGIALLWLYLTLPIPIYGDALDLALRFFGQVHDIRGALDLRLSHADSQGVGGGLHVLWRPLAEDLRTRYVAADGSRLADRVSFHSQPEFPGFGSAGDDQSCKHTDDALVHFQSLRRRQIRSIIRAGGSDHALSPRRRRALTVCVEEVRGAGKSLAGAEKDSYALTLFRVSGPGFWLTRNARLETNVCAPCISPLRSF